MLHIPAPALLRGECSISGAVGGDYIEEAIRFSQFAHIEPMIETFPLERTAEAYESMLMSRVHFRAVLRMDR